MTIECEECLRIISRQIDRATSDKETQAARTHAIKCETCRAKFNAIAGADRLIGKAIHSFRLTDGFSAKVAEKLAEAHLAESVKGPPKAMALVALGLAAIAILLAIMLAMRSGPDIPSIGEISRFEGGEIEFSQYGTQSFSAASTGMEIPEGARLQTRLGSGIVRLEGDRNFAMNSETLVDLSKYHDGAKILLESGEIYVFVPETDMQVDTPGGKIYGSKAKFIVRYENSGKTVVAVKSGEVNLFSESGAVLLEKEKKAEMREGEKPGAPEKANLDNYLGWIRRLGL